MRISKDSARQDTSAIQSRAYHGQEEFSFPTDPACAYVQTTEQEKAQEQERVRQEVERVATAEKKAKEDAIVREGAKLMEVCACFGKKLHSSDFWDNRTQKIKRGGDDGFSYPCGSQLYSRALESSGTYHRFRSSSTYRCGPFT